MKDGSTLANPTGASLPLRTVVRAAAPLSRWISLDAASLMEAAVRATRLEDWGDSAFREGLDRFLAAADGHARLNFVGRVAAARGVSSFLRNQLRFVQACKDAPDALAAPPRAPLVIAALPRTGSSLLQQLLAAHPDALFIPLWLGLQPMAPPDDAEWRARGSRARRRGALRTVALVRIFQPAMMAKHPVGADRPVECAYFMMSTFQALQWWAIWPVYGYAEWIEQHGTQAAYGAFRSHLQLVQHSVRGSHWVLKSPGHFLRFDELREALPEARIVRLHRDPVDVMASTHSLFATAHGLMSDDVDHARVAAINGEALARAADRAVATRTDPDRVLDLHYEDVVARPLEVVRRIHAWAGIRHNEDVEAAVRACLRDNPQARFGTHRYRADDLIEPEATRARFAAYTNRFLDPSRPS